MINKVFVYSEEEAKKSGTNLVVAKVFGLIVINSILFFVLPIVGIPMLVFTLIYSVYQLVNNSNEEANLISYAIDNNGNIFEICLLPSGDDVNCDINVINNSESISKLMETKPINISICEFLKVYSIKESKTKFKVACDIMNLTNNNKVYYKKNIIIKKCYSDYEILIDELNKKKD